MAPKFKTMLPSSPTGPTECLQILALDFRSAMFGALGDNRHYEAWLAAMRLVSAYRYHERVLKLLQWKFPTRPWRLKSPAHMATIDALLEVYPDGAVRDDPPRHRAGDPVGGEPARRHLASSCGAGRSPRTSRPTRRRTGSGRCARRWPSGTPGTSDRFFDIGFAEMRPDPIPAIDRFYGWLGVELTDDVVARMRTWWETNPADKQGVHDYTPEQYGIDLDELRDQFAFYNDRFAASAAPGDPS